MSPLILTTDTPEQAKARAARAAAEARSLWDGTFDASALPHNKPEMFKGMNQLLAAINTNTEEA